MRKSILYFVVALSFCMTGFASYGQNSGEQQKGIITYDPLFWKDQLKLKESQCRSIRSINYEYYESLKDVMSNNQSVDVTTARRVLAQSLMKRSQKIWEVFDTTQRRKWKSLWVHRYGGEPSASI